MEACLPNHCQEFFQNSRLRMLGEAGSTASRSPIKGGAQIAVQRSLASLVWMSETSVSAVIEIVPKERASGTAAPSLGTCWSPTRSVRPNFSSRTGPGRSRCVRRATTTRTA